MSTHDVSAIAAGGAAIDPTELRRAFGSFTTGVTVITTVDAAGRPHGMTVNSFASVSLDPPLVLWSLRQRAYTFDVYDQATHFAVNVLAEDQIGLAQLFASKVSDRFSQLAVQTGAGGVPLLPGCVAHIECATQMRHPGGDHVIYIGQVLRAQCRPAGPLVFSQGRYAVASAHQASADRAAA